MLGRQRREQDARQRRRQEKKAKQKREQKAEARGKAKRLLLFPPAEKFHGDNESKTDKAPDDGRGDVKLPVRDGGGVMPRPYFHERAEDKTYEHEHCGALIVGKQPMQEFGESEYADDTSQRENKEYGQIQSADGAHYIIVFAENDKDETS